MPQVYRRHSERTQRPAPEPRRRNTLLPQPVDADDSFVISDLVRTGEASRLRRRGAMRIDHGQSGAAARLAPSSSALNPPARDAPRPASRFVDPTAWMTPQTTWTAAAAADVSAEDEFYGGGEWREWAGDDRAGGSGGAMQVDEGRADGGAQDDDDRGFVLFCGGERGGGDASSVASSSGTAFRPSLFPLSAASAPSTRAAERATCRTNGCGALVHMHAFPQGPRGVWVGKQEASDAVVGLEAGYFESSVVAKMMKSACGCVREGIACAVCGNTLGTSHAPSSRPPGPSGPQYWRSRPNSSAPASASSSRAPSSFYVYTFFADHVSSSPAYSFPETAKHQGAHGQADQAPGLASRPTSPPMMYGYRITASPRPVSPYPLPPATPGPSNQSRSPNPNPEPPLVTSFLLPQDYSPPSTPPPQSFVRTPQLALDMSQSAAGTFVGAPARGGEDGAGSGQLDPDGVLVEMDDAEEPNSPDKTTEMVWPGR